MYKLERHGASLLLICASLTLSRPLPAVAQPAQPQSTPFEATSGTLYFPSEDGTQYLAAPVLKSEVDLQVTGLIVRATLRQRFHNPTTDWVEGLYVFPLPEMAAVDGLRLTVGDRVIEGQIQEKEAARRAYSEARDSGRAASLVEQKRPNVFTTEVANIPPEEEVTVEIDYQQALTFDDAGFRLRFPMLVAPRYASSEPEVDPTIGLEQMVEMLHGKQAPPGWLAGTLDAVGAVPHASRVAREEGLIHPVHLSISLDAGFPIESLSSPSHAIAIAKPTAERREVEVHAYADRDFVLDWKPQQGAEPRLAVFSETHGSGGSALLMLLPPTRAASTHAMPREVVIVIDTSGSMGGASIRQARAALNLALDRLGPADWFNVIAFDSETVSLFEHSQPASAPELARARAFVQGLEANGGTEMRPALERALGIGPTLAAGALRQVVFITDGSIANEAELFELVHQKLGDSRLFPVGIGSAPNGYLLKRIARFGRGTYTFIATPAEVAERMSGLFDKLERPALRDVEVIFNDDVEMWPERIPDLYAGEPLIVTARASRFVGDVLVRGRLGGRAWEQRMAFTAGTHESGIGKLWARAKIAALMDSLSSGADRDGVRASVTEVALQHHLVSRFTSLVAVDVTPIRAPDTALSHSTLPLNTPRGWVHPNGSVMPRGATPAGLWWIASALCAALSALFARASARLGSEEAS
jgi:Ca-activated chloride channel family protein